MQFIDLHRQYERIERTVQDGISKVLDHKKFIMGPEVDEFEEKLKKYTGVKHVICCASGTDALVLPLRAYGLKETDAVFVPSFSFFASAESISLAGGTPVFVDCDKDTFNISVDSLKKAIENVKKNQKLTPKGIVAVDLFGLPANFPEIKKIAQENNLFILEDAAQGFGGRIKEKVACSFGDVAATSFFPAKPLGCYGDGGAVFTNDDDMAEKIRSIHVHGQGVDKYDNVRIGLNSRLDTIQAVILNAKIDIFEDELKLRNKVAQEYEVRLKESINTPKGINGYISSWAQYTLKARNAEERKKITNALAEASVPTAIYYATPIHLSSAYKDIKGDQIDLPNTEEICNKVFSIPMHPYLNIDEIEKISDIISSSVSA